MGEHDAYTSKVINQIRDFPQYEGAFIHIHVLQYGGSRDQQQLRQFISIGTEHQLLLCMLNLLTMDLLLFIFK